MSNRTPAASPSRKLSRAVGDIASGIWSSSWSSPSDVRSTAPGERYEMVRFIGATILNNTNLKKSKDKSTFGMNRVFGIYIY